MRQGMLVCEFCGSPKIGLNQNIGYATVQSLSIDTKKPIGIPKTYIYFKCISCGEDVSFEKYEALVNLCSEIN